MKTPRDIVFTQMYDQDNFSKWLGIDIVEIAAGFCEAKLTIRSEMLNGFQIAHGGITYALADSAFAFASNSKGRQAVSIETNISHVAKVVEGDVLIAKTKLINESKRLAIYHVDISNQDEKLVATFKGTVYFTGKEW